ncbi:MAG: nucleoside triphosphate pyrophosphohydrolase [Deltaproteobacteria bacterium]|nr:MAG: nucleoside triphosphate pyrophosphohydrolase [Deltaproteobacteria bacterium]
MPGNESRDRLAEAFHGLVDLVRTLRGPGGCPWDAEQTFTTIKMYLLEEAYEVLDAVEAGDMEEVCAELGDLLFQVIFLAYLAEEKGHFTSLDVLERIREKMVRRHPHVFGRARVRTPEEVADNWAQIKKSEKGDSAAPASSLGDIPVNLPALLRAHRLWERASKAFRGRGPVADETRERVRESFASLEEALEAGDKDGAAEATGILLFRLAGLSRNLGFNAEHLLRSENAAFIRCFQTAEEILRARGVDPEGATTEQIEAAWQEAVEKGQARSKAGAGAPGDGS